MAAIPVFIKHQGKRHEVELDPSTTGETFKMQVYSLTGVEPERQKILIKGGQLKDDTDLSTIKAKAGQVFMMMGTAKAEMPRAVEAKPEFRFREDMTDAEMAQLEGAIPAGLFNLGNTCYLNSTLQTLRTIPELHDQLGTYKGTALGAGSSSDAAFSFGQGGAEAGQNLQYDIPAALRDLYQNMGQTQEGVPPYIFVEVLRGVFPQFAQRARNGQGYAQQDAEEAWSQIVSNIRTKLKTSGQENAAGTTSDNKLPSGFVDRYMAGTFETTMKCDDPAAAEAGEQPTTTQEAFLKLDCHISKDTNHLRDGMLAALTEQIDKHSPTLDREASYTKTSRISRLPKYLTVHFVRFFWKREAQKKAKIMRKVTFPAELDTVEFCTDDLRKKLIPVRDKLRELRKDEEDMTRARKRQKHAHQQELDRAQDAANPSSADKTKASGTDKTAGPAEPLEKAKAKKEAAEQDKGTGSTIRSGDTKSDTAMPDADAAGNGETYKTDAEYEAERAAALRQAKQELRALIDPTLAADDGANASGIYELRGVVTHQGASADSGHYTAYVKKRGTVVDGRRKEEDGKWWWFNDEKVSEVDADKIETLAGGGESHSALILLYGAIELPSAQETEDPSTAASTSASAST